MRRVLEHNLFVAVFFHFAALDKITCDAHEIGVAGVEAHIVDAGLERAFYNIKQCGRIAADVGCDREDIAHTRREILVELGAMAQMLGKGFRLIADRDAHAGGDAEIGIKADLRVQHELAAGDRGILRVKAADNALNGIHDAHAKRVGVGIVAVELAGALQKRVDTFGQTGDAEHTNKAVLGEQPLLDEEVGRNRTARR